MTKYKREGIRGKSVSPSVYNNLFISPLGEGSCLIWQFPGFGAADAALHPGATPQYTRRRLDATTLTAKNTLTLRVRQAVTRLLR